VRTPARSRAAALAAAAAVAVLALGVTACGGGGGDEDQAGGVVRITMWHGQNDIAKKALDGLVKDFNASHPKIRVEASSGGVLADQMLQKITAGLAAGSYPDIAYIFGSDVANVARSDKVADLTETVKDPAFQWSDYYPAARDAVTIDGRVRALPALIDSMAIVYNRRLFEKAGVPAPRAGWTWDDYRATAKRLTDRGAGVFGTGWPAVGDEDTVWRLWPMVWQGGGDVVARDGKHVGFDGPSGLRSLTVAGDLAVTDKSLYVDTKPGSEQMYQVFNSNKMAMVPTGPWQLPEFDDNDIDYGVAPLPTFGGPPVTIAGPDTWTVFDNGDARRKAAAEFVQWLNQPAQDARWDLEAGSLPLRKATLEQPAWRKHLKESPQVQVFIDALQDARVRPTIRAYPKVSEATGQAIVAVLLGKATPQEGLKDAVQKSNAALAAPAP
jgi:multiple sugar transport system substrate-binding protein